jgi:hypothetical protein
MDNSLSTYRQHQWASRAGNRVSTSVERLQAVVCPMACPARLLSDFCSQYVRGRIDLYICTTMYAALVVKCSSNWPSAVVAESSESGRLRTR